MLQTSTRIGHLFTHVLIQSQCYRTLNVAVDLVVVERLVCPKAPESDDSGSVWPLAGLTIPDKFQVRGQIKASPLALQVGGWAWR